MYTKKYWNLIHLRNLEYLSLKILEARYYLLKLEISLGISFSWADF